MILSIRYKISILISLCLPYTIHLSAQTTNHEVFYKKEGTARYVNPFIGTAGEGSTYPHATTPWGMVSAGPHTTYTTKLGYIAGQKIAPGGYYSGEPVIEGFGQTHLSGVACPELGAPVLAVNSKKLTPQHYKSLYRNEIAKAGYYSVILDDVKTKVEITTSTRAAYYRFTFMDEETNYILLDASTNLSWGKQKGFIKKIDKQTYCGWSQTGNFCNQGNEQKVWFYMKAKTVCDKSSVWSGKKKILKKKQAEGKVGAWLSYDNAKSVDVIIGISYVSAENAKQNVEMEIGNKNFETVLEESVNKWEEMLSRIEIFDNEKEKEKELFYTALYHSLLHPNIVSDVNGDYPLYKATGSSNNKQHPRYGLFSMWDSYRNVHPLLSLFYPQQEQDILYTIEEMTFEAKHAPRWELYGSEVNLMVGDPALSILAEGYVKGYKFKHPDSLFSILYSNAIDTNSTWRPGNAAYWKKGFIPEKTNKVWGSVSTTLEYSYHDWALGQFALKLEEKEKAETLMKQSKRWQTLFDTQLKVVRPKDENGKFISKFDPTRMDDSWLLSLIVKNHGGPGFVEGNAFQYTFMVPHDVNGLINLFGTKNEFGYSLKNVFENGHFTLWNEPDMIYPYLLGLDKKQWEYMQMNLHYLRTTYFTDKPNGLPGNDDAGTLSSWYVFTALGFYPINPASGEYSLGIPLFNTIQIRMPQTDSLLRITSDFNGKSELWKKVKYNDTILKTLSISHGQIINGGYLIFSGVE